MDCPKQKYLKRLKLIEENKMKIEITTEEINTALKEYIKTLTNQEISWEDEIMLVDSIGETVKNYTASIDISTNL